MAKLQWDRVGQRLYEAGIDRGVLYLSNDLGVAWNGLTSVEEDLEDTSSEPVFFDGTKVLDRPILGDFAATLHAFTYPDEFLEYEGVVPAGPGLFVDGQSPKLFGLSYRTRVGNDVEGTDLGYKVHIIYNLTAVPDTKSYTTQSLGSGPMDFSWSLTAVPEDVPGFRPTAHVILDSRFLPADILGTIEDILYGSDGHSGDLIYDGGYAGAGLDLIDGGIAAWTSPDEIDFNRSDHIPVDGNETYIVYRETIDGGEAGTIGDPLPDGTYEPGDPRIPSIDELIGLVSFWGPRTIIPHSSTGVAQLLPGPEGDITQTGVAGIYTALPENRLQETAVPGIYTLT